MYKYHIIIQENLNYHLLILLSSDVSSGEDGRGRGRGRARGHDRARRRGRSPLPASFPPDGWTTDMPTIPETTFYDDTGVTSKFDISNSAVEFGHIVGHMI